MIITVAAREFDLSGVLEVKPLLSSTFGTMGRRVVRQGTLDGSVVITDRGYSDGDRTITLAYKPVSKAHDDIARRIIQLHSLVTVSMNDGCYEAAPDTFEPTAEENQLTLLVKQRLSEA